MLEAVGRQTALQVAVAAGQLDGVKVLLRAGAVWSHQDDWGWTALHQATETPEPCAIFPL